jgi:RES domain-containing protein
VSFVSLWRIAAETRLYKADDLSGAGAARHPGRWNEEGDAVVYASPSRALAVLETAAHLDDSGLPLNRFLVRIDVPAPVWAKRQKLEGEKIDAGWRAIPAGRTSSRLGHEWYTAGKSALLLVPSVIVEEDSNVLINPKHAGAAGMTAAVVRLFEYNRLFRGA